MKAHQAPGPGAASPRPDGSPRHSPRPDPPGEATLGLGRPLLQLGGHGGGLTGGPAAAAVAPSPSLHAMYRQLYDFFGDSLATRFGTGTPPATAATAPVPPEGTRKDPPAFGGDPGATGGAGSGGSARKMPQLTANATVSPRDEDPPAPAARPPPPLPRLPLPAAATAAPGLARCRGPPRQPPGHRPGARDLFPKCRFAPRGTPRFSFVIAGRQTGRRCQGRRFQSPFATHPPAPPPPPLPPPLQQQQPPALAAAPHHPPGAGHGGRYAQKLPVIGRGGRSGRRWPRSEYSLLLPL